MSTGTHTTASLKADPETEHHALKGSAQVSPLVAGRPKSYEGPRPILASLLLRAPVQDVTEKIALDIIIPTYRLHIPTLQIILSLRPSLTCSVTFILVVDDPASPPLPALQDLVSSLNSNLNAHTNVDIRLLVNPSNLGAPASRNTASTSTWVHFLDDDVLPSPTLLLEAERAIRELPEAAGFGADGVFSTAVRMTGLVGFWDLAEKLGEGEEMPWGITANLIVRRKAAGFLKISQINTHPPLFDPSYPKPGGGEDVDFCLRQSRWSRSSSHNGAGFLPAPKAIVCHPWWDN
ncbi:LOW QUALITY PROTEIN: hypothetical protein CVT26_006310, partial [Gymnopilus dilepis]